MLPDLLNLKLKIVFCGTAAGTVSAQRGAYYAGPGNKFNPILYKIGLTTYELNPKEFTKLIEFGIGLTDIVKTQAGSDSSLQNSAFDVVGFKAKIIKYKPNIVAFNGKKAAAWALGFKGRTRKVGYGLAKQNIGESRVMILPSTSGAANGFWDKEYWVNMAKEVVSNS